MESTHEDVMRSVDEMRVTLIRLRASLGAIKRMVDSCHSPADVDAVEPEFAQVYASYRQLVERRDRLSSLCASKIGFTRQTSEELDYLFSVEFPDFESHLGEAFTQFLPRMRRAISHL